MVARIVHLKSDFEDPAPRILKRFEIRPGTFVTNAIFLTSRLDAGSTLSILAVRFAHLLGATLENLEHLS